MWFSKVGRINLRWSVNCVTLIFLISTEFEDSGGFWQNFCGDDLTGLDPVLPVEAKRHIVKFNRVCPAQLQKARWTRHGRGQNIENASVSVNLSSSWHPKKCSKFDWIAPDFFSSHYLEHERERDRDSETINVLPIKNQCEGPKTSSFSAAKASWRDPAEAHSAQQPCRILTNLHRFHSIPNGIFLQRFGWD